MGEVRQPSATLWSQKWLPSRSHWKTVILELWEIRMRCTSYKHISWVLKIPFIFHMGIGQRQYLEDRKPLSLFFFSVVSAYSLRHPLLLEDLASGRQLTIWTQLFCVEKECGVLGELLITVLSDAPPQVLAAGHLGRLGTEELQGHVSIYTYIYI